MSKSKFALLVLLASGSVVAAGCVGLKWITVASQLGYNITGTLYHLGVVPA